MIKKTRVMPSLLILQGRGFSQGSRIIRPCIPKRFNDETLCR